VAWHVLHVWPSVTPALSALTTLGEAKAAAAMRHMNHLSPARLIRLNIRAAPE